MVTTYTRQKTFSSKVYDFVRDVIRHRNVLMSRQLSSINKMKTLRIIETLTLNSNKSYTDKAAARYFIIYADDILFLIKQDDNKKLKEFREIFELAKPLSII